MPTAIITGASSGIGRGVVSSLLEKRWTVFATLRNARERAHLFAEEKKLYPHTLQLRELDVTSAADRDSLVEEFQRLGRLDCLVNNAGFGLYGALEDLEEEQIRRQLETNFFAPLLLTKALLPMLRAAHGGVLNVSSVLGQDGCPMTSTYCASKFALEGLTESLHYELASHGVRVGLVEPGSHSTGFLESVEWGTGSNPAYYDQTKSFRTALEGRSRKGAEPVVRTLVRLIETQSPALRTRVGVDAAAMKAVERVLPERARIGVYRVFFGRLLKSKKR